MEGRTYLFGHLNDYLHDYSSCNVN